MAELLFVLGEAFLERVGGKRAQRRAEVDPDLAVQQVLTLARGATVYVTGRTTRDQSSEYARPETIEESAELVTRLGGTGIPIQADHLDEALLAAARALGEAPIPPAPRKPFWRR